MQYYILLKGAVCSSALAPNSVMIMLLNAVSVLGRNMRKLAFTLDNLHYSFL